nr:hypothetical protein [Afipia carboxidovorans]
METESDRAAFDIASRPGSSDTAALESVAKRAATIDTLDGFLREMKKRFPDTVARMKAPSAAHDAEATGALPTIPKMDHVSTAR